MKNLSFFDFENQFYFSPSNIQLPQIQEDFFEYESIFSAYFSASKVIKLPKLSDNLENSTNQNKKFQLYF